MANNRFTNLRRAKTASTTPLTAIQSGESKQTAREVAPVKLTTEPPKPSADPNETSPLPPAVAKQAKRGRPRAKRSDTGFAQATAYIRKDTYTAVRHRLLDQRKEYSVLVQELLEKWLKEHK